MKNATTECGRVGSDQIEGRRRHGDQHSSETQHAPVSNQRSKDIAGRVVTLAREELPCFGERSAYHEQERNDEAAQQQGYPPAPRIHLHACKRRTQYYAQQGGEDDRALLARVLPAYVETLVAR